MTIDEAKKIVGIIATANCVSRLCDILNDEFPEFNWEMKDVHLVVVHDDITVEVSIVDKNRENKE